VLPEDVKRFFRRPRSLHRRRSLPNDDGQAGQVPDRVEQCRLFSITQGSLVHPDTPATSVMSQDIGMTPNLH
jgi:hypothetical protein